MSYFKSTEVKMFPSSLRTVDYSKFTTEKNLSGILRAVTDLDSYTISKGSTIKFVIHGYYFEVTPSTTVLSGVTWAGIKIEKIDSSALVSQIDGGTNLEVSNNFNGLSFASTEEG